MDDSEGIRKHVTHVLSQVITMASAEYGCVLTYDRDTDRAAPVVTSRRVGHWIQEAKPPGILPRTGGLLLARDGLHPGPVLLGRSG